MYEVAGAKRKMGQISENELLQLKLAALKARAAVTDAESNLLSLIHIFANVVKLPKIKPWLSVTVKLPISP